MLGAYGRNLLFFVAVSLSWLGPLTTGPSVDPVLDHEAPLRSVGFSVLSIVAWLGLLVGGLWAVSTAGVLVLLLVLLGWGFLVAPVVVAVLSKALFPGIGGRLQAQVDELARARKRRAGAA